MAQETNTMPTIGDWLEEWPLEGIEFKDEASKEVYKNLVHQYLEIWLALYNNHPSRVGKDPYYIKDFGEKPTGPKKLRPFATLTPPVKPHPHSGFIHLIPPEPPPPPKEDQI